MNEPLSTPASRANLFYTIEDASPPSGFPRRADLADSSTIRRLTQTFKIVLRRKGVRTINDKRTSISRFLSLLVVLSVIIPAILSGPVQVALAANTGWLSPTTNAAATGYTALTNPTNAYADDALNATGSGTTFSLGQQITALARAFHLEC